MSRPPLAVLVTGAPGAGKSTVAQQLARASRAALIDLDSATEPLVEVVGELLGVRDLDDTRLAGATRSARYATLTALAVASLSVGTDVVLVAPFTRERREPAAFAALHDQLAAAGAEVMLVWLRIELDELRSRIGRRAAGRDLVKPDPEWIDRLDLAAPVVPHLAVDATHAPHEIATLVLSRLGRAPADRRPQGVR